MDQLVQQLNDICDAQSFHTGWYLKDPVNTFAPKLPGLGEPAYPSKGRPKSCSIVRSVEKWL